MIEGRSDPDTSQGIPGIFLEPRPRWVLPPGVIARRVHDQGIALTARMEGYRKHLYSDPAGMCTIGYGHLVKPSRCDGSEEEGLRRGLSKEEALDLLRDDMGLAERALAVLAKVELTDGQHAALCDFAYNVGARRLAESTLLQRVNEGRLEAAPGQFRRYVVAKGRKLPGLVVRREKEIELFFDGVPIPRSAGEAGEDLSPIDIAEFD